MIRSITSSTFAAIMSLPPSTELPGPKNSRSGPKSAVWVGNKFLLPMAGDANSVTPMEQVDGARRGVVAHRVAEGRAEAAQILASHGRRDKAALFQWVQAPPGDRSSRKQPEQTWRRRSV